jgi:hypothetical protein
MFTHNSVYDIQRNAERDKPWLRPRQIEKGRSHHVSLSVYSIFKMSLSIYARASRWKSIALG